MTENKPETERGRGEWKKAEGKEKEKTGLTHDERGNIPIRTCRCPLENSEYLYLLVCFKPTSGGTES